MTRCQIYFKICFMFKCLFYITEDAPEDDFVQINYFLLFLQLIANHLAFLGSSNFLDNLLIFSLENISHL